MNNISSVTTGSFQWVGGVKDTHVEFYPNKDGRFLMFEHNFYNSEGKNLAYAEILFSWIDIKKRKIGIVPPKLLATIESFPRSQRFKYLTKEDLKKNIKQPKDMTK